MTKLKEMSQEKLNQIEHEQKHAEYLIEKYQLDAVDIELQKRKHERSIFGTVPLSFYQYVVYAAADKAEALAKKEPTPTEEKE